MLINCFFTKAKSSLDFVYPLIAAGERSDVRWRLIFWRDLKALLKEDTFYRQALKNLPPNVEIVLIENELSGIMMRKSWMWGTLAFLSGVHPIFRNVLNRIMSQKMKDFVGEEIFKSYGADIYFMDHRNFGDFWGFTKLKSLLSEKEVKVVLYPHAPHHTGINAFVPYSKEEMLGSKMDYWMPFLYDEYWTSLPESKDQFFYSGYPGLDQKWLDSLNGIENKSREPKKFVLIIRKVFPPSVTENPAGHDNYAFFYDEFKSLLDGINTSLGSVFSDYTLYLKPHPSTDFKLLTQTIQEVDPVHIRIDDNPIFEQVGKFDVFLSFYTTTILIPVLGGKPSFVIDSRIQKELLQWPILNDLYGKLDGFCENFEVLTSKLQQLKNSPDQYSKYVEHDIKHVRSYYPDHSISLIFKRLESIYERSAK